MKTAVYPGSFDPMTNGHLDIITRASKIFDHLVVLVSNNVFKKYRYNAEKRVMMIKKSISHLSNVTVEYYDGLVVDYCKEKNIGIIIRGLRNFQDYESEFSFFQFNRDLNPNVETMIIFPSTRNLVITSSAVRELILFKQDISNYVPSSIIDDILNND